ncbi:MAG TPA: hypothetical protein VL048_03675 [Xanthobacteraceae bacterium]|nr:hypothetical protein [Xanthobacteraceae bacterium]
MSGGKTKLPAHEIPAVPFEIVYELPPSIHRKIGKVVSAHAFLEYNVLELLCDLSQVDYPIGRVILRYQAASERFKTIRRLLILRGIKTSFNLKNIFERIEQSCKKRDMFAHGVWVATKTGSDLALAVTRGEYEIEGGVADRSFVPQSSTFSSEYCENTKNESIELAHTVRNLRDEIVSILEAQTAKS